MSARRTLVGDGATELAGLSDRSSASLGRELRDGRTSHRNLMFIVAPSSLARVMDYSPLSWSYSLDTCRGG